MDDHQTGEFLKIAGTRPLRRWGPRRRSMRWPGAAPAGEPRIGTAVRSS